MNRMISLAKIMFAGLAIYLLIAIVQSMLISVFFSFQTFKKSKNFDWESLGTLCLSTLVSIAMIAAVIWFLIVRGEVSARKLIGKNIADDKPLNIDLTLTMAFRLVCVGAGLLCFRNFSYSFANIINILLLTIQRSDKSGEHLEIFSNSLRVNYVLPTLYLALAIYLICGAPHFVRWQVKKTLKLCDKK